MNAGSLYAPRDQPEKESKREKKRKKKNTGWPSFFKQGPLFLFSKGSFIPLLVHRGKWKMQSHTVSPNITSVLSLSKLGFLLQTFPINNVVYIIFWPWRPVNISWPSFDKGCSTRKLFSLKVFFLYISNLCQPQKMPNRVNVFHRAKVQWVTRMNQLAQKSDMVKFKATLVFLAFSLC